MTGFATAALGLTAVLSFAAPAPADGETQILEDAVVAIEAEQAVIEQMPQGAAPPEALRVELISADQRGVSVLRRAADSGVELSAQATFVLERMPRPGEGDVRVVADYVEAIEIVEARLAASTDVADLSFADEVDLINQAIEALEAGDLATFEALGDEAVRLPTMPPLIGEVFADHDIEQLINIAELFDETDLEMLTWADDAVQWEGQVLAEHLAGAGDAETLPELFDADDSGAAVLFLIADRDVALSGTVERVLGELDLDAPPAAADYERARLELRTMYDNGITRHNELTTAMLEPTAPSTSGGLGLAGWLALGSISAAAVGLGIFGLHRSRQAEGFAGLAMTDGLTGLNNRRKFDNDIDATSGGAAVAVLMVDVDHFKRFNDAHGHALGDDVLRRVGAVIADAVRQGDVAYRYGGEEFSVLLPDTHVDEARRVAERVRTAISSIDIDVPTGGVTGVTASVGVATGLADALPEVVQVADAALYEAKADGRNRVSVR